MLSNQAGCRIAKKLVCEIAIQVYIVTCLGFRDE
jgi:hypothetical protein